MEGLRIYASKLKYIELRKPSFSRTTSKFAHQLLLVLVVLALVLTSHALVFATPITFTWSGLPIAGEAGQENPNFFPSGSAEFTVSGSTLTIVLTNDTAQQLTGVNQVLSGLTWDITNAGVTLTPIDPTDVVNAAVVAAGSQLVGVGATDDTDLSGEWAFRGDIMAGSGVLGPLGPYAIGTMGSINFDAASFGPGDRLNTDPLLNLFGPSNGSLNGIEVGIVGPDVDFTLDGFKTKGPVVQGNNETAGQIVFTFTVSGDLTEDGIERVQPLFGTDGAPRAPVIPEPSTILLLGSGLAGIGGYSFRRKKKKA